MITHENMLERWGSDNILYFPVDKFESRIQFDFSLLPPHCAIPEDVPVLFTVYCQNGIKLFNVLEVSIGNHGSLDLVVLGSVPGDPAALYCLDTVDGAVVRLTTDTSTFELVNSTFALFVEFLYHLQGLIDTDLGGTARATRARELRTRLTNLDPQALEDEESWWSIAFSQLESTR